LIAGGSQAAGQRRGAWALAHKSLPDQADGDVSAFGGTNNWNTFGRKIYRFSNSQP
jgi:hypothetical protein